MALHCTVFTIQFYLDYPKSYLVFLRAMTKYLMSWVLEGSEELRIVHFLDRYNKKGISQDTVKVKFFRAADQDVCLTTFFELNKTEIYSTPSTLLSPTHPHMPYIYT